MTTLAELRLANLREQKKSAAEPAAVPAEPAAVPAEPAAVPAEPAAVPAEPAAVPAEPAAVPAEPAAVPEAVAQTSAAPELSAMPEVIPVPPASASPAEREEDLVLSQFVSQVIEETAVLSSPEAERAAALMTRIQAMLAVKTLHPNGAKATVDMSPALFHRAKRYCLDHGNVTLRQLFLDLLTAFLDEEGY